MTTRTSIRRAAAAAGTPGLVLAAMLLGPAPLAAQVPGALAVPMDSPRWALQGKATQGEHQGRKCLLLDGGAAVLGDFQLRDGMIDVDVATSAPRGFFGIQFRIAPDGMTAEEIYLRQHKSGLPDAMQFTPVLGGGATGRSTTGPASPDRSTFRRTRGSTSGWR